LQYPYGEQQGALSGHWRVELQSVSAAARGMSAERSVKTSAADFIVSVEK